MISGDNMNTIIIILLTIIIIISIFTVSYILLYNKIQFSKIRIEEAEHLIVDELTHRYEIVMKTKKMVEKNTKMDLSLYNDLEQLKGNNVTSYELEKKITEAINTIYLITNDHPKLEEKKEYKDIIRKLEESDTKITAAKSFYNKHNMKLNTLIKTFPCNIISMIHGIKIQPYYDGKEIFNEVDDGIKI